jgi:hypothetical protein
VVAGDFDHNGSEDLAFGCPREDLGGAEDAGVLNVVYGSPLGLIYGPYQAFHQNTPYIEGWAEGGDRLGEVAAVGDFNRDGYDDVAVTALGESINGADLAGAVNVIYGSSSGLSHRFDQVWHQDSWGIAEKAEYGDGFGTALTVGDFNHDGRDDLAIGAPHDDVGTVSGAGVVHVIFGSSRGGLTSDDDRLIREGDGKLEPGSGTLWGVAGQHEKLGFSLAAGDFNADTSWDGFKNHLVIGVPKELRDFATGGNTRTGLVHVLWPWLDAYQHPNSYITLRP